MVCVIKLSKSNLLSPQQFVVQSLHVDTPLSRHGLSTI
jgi:hypothetical protein